MLWTRSRRHGSDEGPVRAQLPEKGDGVATAFVPPGRHYVVLPWAPRAQGRLDTQCPHELKY